MSQNGSVMCTNSHDHIKLIACMSGARHPGIVCGTAIDGVTFLYRIGQDVVRARPVWRYYIKFRA
jgi:hypothetical protein